MRHAGRDDSGRTDPGRPTRRRPRHDRQGVGPHRRARASAVRPPTSPCCAGSPSSARDGWTRPSSRTPSRRRTCSPARRRRSWPSSAPGGCAACRARSSGGPASSAPDWPLIIVLAAVFLASNPPTWIKGAALGAGAAVAPVAVNAALGLIPASWRRAGPAMARRVRWVVYAAVGGVAAATVGTFLVLVLLGCGLVEVAALGAVRPPERLQGFRRGAAGRRGHRRAGRIDLGRAQGRRPVVRRRLRDHPADAGRRRAPLPLDDEQRSSSTRWRSDRSHRVRSCRRSPSSATPPPAWAARSWRPSSPSHPRSLFIVVGARHFGALRTNRVAQSFLGGAGPAAIGAIAGASIPLALAIAHVWQVVILAGCAGHDRRAAAQRRADARRRGGHRRGRGGARAARRG